MSTAQSGGCSGGDGCAAGPQDSAIIQTMQILRSLLRTWTGRGRGRFPTIDPFDYEEEIRFEANDVEPLLHYEQRTWDVTHHDARTEPLHWESGFVRPTEDGWVEISNAQNGGRVEVLRGKAPSADRRDDEPFLEVTSVLLGHDERMGRTRRRYVLRGNVLSYEMEMATQSTPALTMHLQASLRRTT